MELQNFKDLSFLFSTVSSVLKIKNKTLQGESAQMSNIVHIQESKDKLGHYCFKYKFEEAYFHEVNMKKKRS